MTNDQIIEVLDRQIDELHKLRQAIDAPIAEAKQAKYDAEIALCVAKYKEQEAEDAAVPITWAEREVWRCNFEGEIFLARIMQAKTRPYVEVLKPDPTPFHRIRKGRRIQLSRPANLIECVAPDYRTWEGESQ